MLTEGMKAKLKRIGVYNDTEEPTVEYLPPTPDEIAGRVAAKIEAHGLIAWPAGFEKWIIDLVKIRSQHGPGVERLAKALRTLERRSREWAQLLERKPGA